MKIARQELQPRLKPQGELFSQRALALARDDRPYWVRIIPQIIVGFLNHPREVPLVLIGVVDSTQTDLCRAVKKKYSRELISNDFLEEVVQSNLGFP